MKILFLAVLVLFAFVVIEAEALNYNSPSLIPNKTDEFVRSLDSDNGITVSITDENIYVYDESMKLSKIIRSPDGYDVVFNDVKINDNDIIVSGFVDEYGGCKSVLVVFHYDLISEKLLNTFTPLNKNSNEQCWITFGYSFDFSEDKLVVGARQWEDYPDVPGTGFVYELSSGSLLYSINSVYPEPKKGMSKEDLVNLGTYSEDFGRFTLISDNYVIITESGVVNSKNNFEVLNSNIYVFDSKTGNLLHKIPIDPTNTPNDFEIQGNLGFTISHENILKIDLSSGKIIREYDYAGVSIDVKNNLIVFGIPVQQQDAGIVYVMDHNTGEIKNQFQNPFDDRIICKPSGCIGDKFGSKVSFKNNDIVALAETYFDRGGSIFEMKFTDSPQLPILTLPEDIVKQTVDDSSIIEYSVFAKDSNGIKLEPICKPKSGSLFLTGETIVVCHATDYSGNTVSGDFRVIIGKDIQSNEVKTTQSSIESKLENQFNPVSKDLGIASFVDKSKDPQYYVDRYNNEPDYKDWFDHNYPQYDSIEQAVGLELTEKIPDWVKNIFGWYANDQVSEDELLNAIKYLINEGILIVE